MKARDARRMSDTREIRTAYYLFYAKYGDWVTRDYGGAGAGTICDGGSWAPGYGWYNAKAPDNTSPPNSGPHETIMNCLIHAKVISAPNDDPLVTPGRAPYYINRCRTAGKQDPAYIVIDRETVPNGANPDFDGCTSFYRWKFGAVSNGDYIHTNSFCISSRWEARVVALFFSFPLILWKSHFHHSAIYPQLAIL